MWLCQTKGLPGSRRRGRRMRRRDAIALLGGAVAWPFGVFAQEAGRTYRIAYLGAHDYRCAHALCRATNDAGVIIVRTGSARGLAVGDSRHLGRGAGPRDRRIRRRLLDLVRTHAALSR